MMTKPNDGSVIPHLARENAGWRLVLGMGDARTVEIRIEDSDIEQCRTSQTQVRPTQLLQTLIEEHVEEQTESIAVALSRQLSAKEIRIGTEDDGGSLHAAIEHTAARIFLGELENSAGWRDGFNESWRNGACEAINEHLIGQAWRLLGVELGWHGKPWPILGLVNLTGAPLRVVDADERRAEILPALTAGAPPGTTEAPAQRAHVQLGLLVEPRAGMGHMAVDEAALDMIETAIEQSGARGAIVAPIVVDTLITHVNTGATAPAVASRLAPRCFAPIRSSHRLQGSDEVLLFFAAAIES